jgi:hypothetical protein
MPADPPIAARLRKLLAAMPFVPFTARLSGDFPMAVDSAAEMTVSADGLQVRWQGVLLASDVTSIE